MQYVEVFVVLIIVLLMLLIVVFMGWVLYFEKLWLIVVVGLIVGVIGVLIIMGVWLQYGLDVLGLILCLIGVVVLIFVMLVVCGVGGSCNMMMIVGL